MIRDHSDEQGHCRKITASDVARLTRKEMINDFSPINDIPDRRRSLSDMQGRQAGGDAGAIEVNVLDRPAGVDAEGRLKELIGGPETEVFEL